MRKSSFFIKMVVLMLGSFFLLTTFVSAASVKIGFSGDFSGTSFKMTKDALQAATLAVEEINGAGGILGQQVEIIERDGGARPELHARLVHELVEQEKVVALFGGASSNCVLGASAVAKELKVPYLVSVGNSPSIIYGKGHRYVFLFEPNLTMEIKAWAEWASKKPWRKYAFIAPDYEGTRWILKIFKEEMTKRGIELEWKKELWHKLGETTFTSHIPVIKAAKPDVLFLGTFGASLNAFILQANQAGLFKRMDGFGLIAEDTCMALGKNMPNNLSGFSRGAFQHFMHSVPAGKEFTEKYHKKYGTYPGGYSFCAYDSVIAWAKAVKKAGSFDAEKTVDALKGLEFSGPRGDQIVRAVDGQLSCPVCIGPLKYNKDLGFYIIDPVSPISAESLWLSEEEVKAKYPRE